MEKGKRLVRRAEDRKKWEGKREGVGPLQNYF